MMLYTAFERGHVNGALPESIRRNQRGWLALTLCLVSACSDAPNRPADRPTMPWFEEVADATDIDFLHARADVVQFYFPEIMSGGGGWIDYDRDGWLDLYLVQGGKIGEAEDNPYRNKLLRNVSGQRFEDVSVEAGVDDGGYGMGVAVGDYDNDGDDDLYVTNVGPNVLYRNEGGGRFTDVSKEAGVNHDGWGTSAAFADYDADGLLDLFVVNYIYWAPEQELECTSLDGGRDYCHPDNYGAPATDVLLHNEGNGRFRDVTTEARIVTAKANGLGIVAADFNADLRVDFYVANDGDPNHLWINNGDGTFTDRALITGSALNRQGMAEASMGVAAFDLENDGDPDLFMTHLRDETNTLYRNDGGLFQDITNTAGVAVPSFAYTGFGVGVADFDHDGNTDLYIANGRVVLSGAEQTGDPFSEPNQLFKGTARFTFEEVLPAGGVSTPLVATSRAVAQGDFDNDGDVDILVVNNGGRAHLLRNEAAKNGNWIGFHVTNRFGGDAIGALLAIHTGGTVFRRAVQRAGSYQSSHDPRVQVGVGGATTVDSALVLWPNGQSTKHGPFEAGKYYPIQIKQQN